MPHSWVFTSICLQSWMPDDFICSLFSRAQREAQASSEVKLVTAQFSPSEWYVGGRERERDAHLNNGIRDENLTAWPGCRSGNKTEIDPCRKVRGYTGPANTLRKTWVCITQAWSGRKVKQEQDETSRNHNKPYLHPKYNIKTKQCDVTETS